MQAFRDESLELEARIIEAIKRVGPKNVSLLAKMTGAHQETIRYKIKKQLRGLGFRIHADVDFGKIGLVLHWSTLKFSRQYLQSANRILTILNEIGYLTYYAKIIPQSHYVALFALPAGSTNEYRKFLGYLQKLGIIEDFSFAETLVSRHNSMNPKYFNFQSGKWDVDWSRVKLDQGNPLRVDGQKVEGWPDYYDLLIIKEYQIDALQHVAAIARKLKLNQKTLEYHYRAHIQKEKLIPRYNVRWTQDIEKSLSHSVQLTRLTASGLDADEFLKLQRIISKIPFLWAEELLGDKTYIATLLIPAQEAITTFDFLSTEVPNLGAKLNVGFIKPHDAYLFTIPYNMFGEGWSFDLDELKSRFNKALKSRK